MILRKFAKHLTEQNWFAVGLDVLVVITGIFLGLQVQEWSEATKLKAEVPDGLQSVMEDLQDDIVRLDEIIAFQKDKLAKNYKVIEMLGADERDDQLINGLIFSMTSDNFTYFPNKAAYQSMKETGKLDVIDDRKTRLYMARLFERILARQDLNAAYYDEMTYNTTIANITPNWSFRQKRPIREGKESLEVLENALMIISDNNRFYVNQLDNEVRPSIVELLKLIDAYQLQH